MSSVSVRGLDIGYGLTRVIEHLSMEIADGEFVVLLGPSGCGKSTLLSAIAGLTPLSAGQIWLDGRNVSWDEPKDRGIGMVFQSYALYPQMSVRGNLSFGLRMAGTPRAEVARRVDAAANLLRLGALLERKPSQLSGGQRQRVAIGRALVRDVGVYLFDEPLSNLDAKLRGELRVELKKLHEQLGTTMIYVTHDQIEALTLADRIAVMDEGVIQQFAAPRDIYRRPANRFVAGFVGSPAMNFITGTCRIGSSGVALETKSGTILPLGGYHFISAPSDGQAVELGIRAEQLFVRPAQSGEATLNTVATVAEPMGADTIIWCTFEEKTLSIRVETDYPFVAGATVSAAFQPTDISIFDAAGGQRL